MIYLFAFILGLVQDFLGTTQTRCVVRGKRWRVVVGSGLLYCLSALTLVVIIESYWCVLPVVFGRMFGSYLAMSFGRKHD